MPIAIKAEHLSKEYRLGTINHGTLYKDLQSWLARKLGRPDPHAPIGVDKFANQSGHFWALKDVSFEIEQGDRVGIIGRNGAGKSTLLKILSRITSPTEGAIGIRGRVSSLLEVGTGFHAELTGRENVYLNGAILGMKRKEIDRKFDEIVAFSEIEDFIDTPAKRYSSGMYVRLAFAVAAYLESDILIADEVLAVGDATFQEKCLGKMEDVSKNQGRTVLFVSHNMPSVRKLCNQGMLFHNGVLEQRGSIDDVVNYYLGVIISGKVDISWDEGKRPRNHGLEICRVRAVGTGDPEHGRFEITHELCIEIEYEVLHKGVSAQFSLSILSKDGQEVGSSLNNLEPNYYKKDQKPGKYKSICTIFPNLLNEGNYLITLTAFTGNWADCIRMEEVIKVKMIDDASLKGDYSGNFGGVIRPLFPWVTKRI